MKKNVRKQRIHVSIWDTQIPKWSMKETWTTKGCKEDFHHCNSPDSALVQTHVSFTRLRSYSNLRQMRLCLPVSYETQLFKVQRLRICHKRYPKTLLSLEQEISRDSLRTMSETGAGQESKGLWRKGRFPGVRVSIWEKHPWVWEHAECGMGQVWALSLSQLTLEQAWTRRTGSPLTHGTQVRRAMHKFLVRKNSPGFSLCFHAVK